MKTSELSAGHSEWSRGPPFEHPCSSTSVSELQPLILILIFDIENCGLFVHVICTDNYPLNVSLSNYFLQKKSLIS